MDRGLYAARFIPRVISFESALLVLASQYPARMGSFYNDALISD
jgi:hypothetical protein